MTTLFDAESSDEEFGATVLSVASLTKWLESKNLTIKTAPPLKDFEYVQIPALLHAIQRGATEGVTHEEAIELVKYMPRLAQDRAANRAAKWLLGADARQQWHITIVEAVRKGELILLDFGSKLPIETLKNDKPAINQKWTDERLYALWKEYLVGDITHEALAKKYGVKRQWIGKQLDVAKKKFSKPTSREKKPNTLDVLIHKMK